MYAIIATGGKQYKVAEGDIIRVEKLGVEAGETVTFDQVLAVNNDGLKVGADVANASVTASVVENGKAKKVIVYNPIVMVSSVESFTAQYSEPFRFSQIMPLQSVYPFSPFIRFSIVARSFALIDCLYSYVLNTSSAK